MASETILVTGGAGYIGSHVVVELARAGYAPVVLDDFSNSTPAVVPRLQALAGRPVPAVTADVRDVVALRSVFHDHPIAGVVHCASVLRRKIANVPLAFETSTSPLWIVASSAATLLPLFTSVATQRSVPSKTGLK